MEVESNYLDILLKKNTRYVIVEKFVAPKYIKNMFNGIKEFYLHKNLIETYKIILRVLDGDDITITRFIDCEINKWRKNPQEISIHLGYFMIEHLKIAALDSGNFETGEEHYNIRAL